MIKIKNLTFTKDGKKIINNLNLEIKKNNVSVIVGSNGSGKSTLAYLLMGLQGYEDYQGDIIYRGKSLKKMSVFKRASLGITLAWQEPVRFEGLTVKKYLENSGNKVNQKEIEIALEKVGLKPENYLERFVDSSLSGGERKKIELASIYLMKPKLVILDEPDSGIDIDSLKYINKIIKEFKSNGSSVILITHNLSALRQGDVFFLMCKGNLLKINSLKEIKSYFRKKCVNCQLKSNFDIQLKK
ncbi:ATP-binding cassette domain-containing protein [Candidatus Wolfebacteria bacterium]|nr:ATP-binding cassette domain-containing protein [Candidatus Wolfebacteria bacterium]